MEDIPEEISFIKPFLKRSKEIENPNSIVSYYVYFYAENLAFNHLKKNPENQKIVQFIERMQKIMEQKKNSLNFPQNPLKHYEKFLTKLFISADDDDRKSGSTRKTAKKFRVLIYFIQAFRILSELPQEWNEKLAYCKWKASDITKSIKNGIKPCSGGPNENLLSSQEVEPEPPYNPNQINQLDSSNLHSKISLPSASLNQSDTSSQYNNFIPIDNRNIILPTDIQNEKSLNLNPIDNTSYPSNNYKSPVLPQNAFDNFNLPQSILNNPTLPPSIRRNSCKVSIPLNFIEDYQMNKSFTRNSYAPFLENKIDTGEEVLESKNQISNIVYKFEALMNTKNANLLKGDEDTFKSDECIFSVEEEKNVESGDSGFLVKKKNSDNETKSYYENMDYERIKCDEAPKIEITDIKYSGKIISLNELSKSFEKTDVLEEQSEKNNRKTNSLEEKPGKNNEKLKKLSNYEQSIIINNAKKIVNNFISEIEKNNIDFTKAIECMREAISTIEILS
ncbi:hypothetical protein SteCoe_16907 [Stentor coeruleus]|uniref:Vta1/callose synthase N-terminal domain-containing protein n=1 Tax=Stentor coeruleus TaxID=5963 RepID=A0A1R2C0B2_9CILI|nr:hypothetical protein SteCoe_16907 [Stentor coeruleus]